MQSVKEKQQKSIDALKGLFAYANSLASPRIEKVVVSVGTGKRTRSDREWNEFVAGRLARITGQKPAQRGAKQSVAAFKTRLGEIIGQSVTLRGPRMYDFLDRFLHIAIPRIRDFRGFSRTSVDEMGNLTLGIREHNIFPETADEELRNIFGIAVTIVTSARTRDEAAAFFEELGVPFKKSSK